MPPQTAVEVPGFSSISLVDALGVPFDVYPNSGAERSSDRKLSTIGRLLAVAPGTRFGVRITHDPGLKLYSADGLQKSSETAA